MPNHYTNQLIIVNDYDAEESPDWRDILKDFYLPEEGPKDILNHVFPMPEELRGTKSPGDSPNWYDWAWDNWGTKWGTYDQQEPVDIPGDTFGVSWSFVTAWSAPNEESRRRICQWLAEHGAQKVIWIGIDPYDDTASVLGEYEK